MSNRDFLLDKRVVDRNVAKGLVTYADLDKHVDALADVEDNAEPCIPDAPEEEEGEEKAEGEEGAEASADDAPSE